MIDLDAISDKSLRDQGSAKWTTYPDTLNAWIAEEDFPLSPAITEALAHAVKVGRTGYTPPALSLATREAVAKWYAHSFGANFATEDVQLTGNVIKSLEATLRLFVPSGDVKVPTPAYMPFLTVPGLFDRKIIEVPMLHAGDWAADLDAIDKAFAAGGKLLILCNPHNPIGHVYSQDELLAISEIVARHDGRVFVDEIHAPLMLADKQHIPYAAINETTAHQAITAFSPSKAWNTPGLKCATLILTNDDDKQLWKQKQGWFSNDASVMGMVATIAALEGGQPWLDEVRQIVSKNSALLADLLAKYIPAAKYQRPQGTYLAWIDLTDVTDRDHLGKWLITNAKVTVTDGAACGAVGRGHIRLNLATTPEILTEIVIRIGSALS